MNRFKHKVRSHSRSVVAGLLCVPLLVLAFFNDIEQVQQQLFTAGEVMLQLEVAEGEVSVGVGESGLGTHERQIGLSEESTAARYEVAAVSAEGDETFCDQLQLKSNFGGIVTIGPIENFVVGSYTKSGIWSLGVPATLLLKKVAHGAVCTVTFAVEAWQEDMPKSTGYHDTDTFRMVFRSSQIVLNEVLAQPDTNAPEFIELYNNGSEPVDVAGWTIEEYTASGATTSHSIASTSKPKSNLIAYDGSASTVVPAGGFLALRFISEQQYLNNNGDTITLFDAAGRQIDTYTYEKAKVKMSDARVPDGFGDWVDPLPTPGAPNMLEVESLTELSIKLSEVPAASDSAGNDDTEEPLVSGQEPADPQVVPTETEAGESGSDPEPAEGEMVEEAALPPAEAVQTPEPPTVEPSGEPETVVSLEEEIKQPEEPAEEPKDPGPETEPEPADEQGSEDVNETI